MRFKISENAKNQIVLTIPGFFDTVPWHYEKSPSTKSPNTKIPNQKVQKIKIRMNKKSEIVQKVRNSTKSPKFNKKPENTKSKPSIHKLVSLL